MANYAIEYRFGAWDVVETATQIVKSRCASIERAEETVHTLKVTDELSAEINDLLARHQALIAVLA